MLWYTVKRLGYMLGLMIIFSIVVFGIIQLPPGDYVDYYIGAMYLERAGEGVMNEEMKEEIRVMLGLDRPLYVQYAKWISNFIKGDLGYSFEMRKPVSELIVERLPYTLLIAAFTLLLAYGVAIPIGIYAARHQYSFNDNFLTILGFIGIATPNFLLALILMFFAYKYFGISIGGLFTAENLIAPWSFAKVIDLLKHLVVPVIVLGTAETAGIIRVMRASLLDELNKQYVITARSKGIKERTLIIRYPVRIALNPIISTITWVLPTVFSGGAIVAIVLGLPTIGPLLFGALLGQDLFLAASCLMILGSLTFIGAFISDILLAVFDPRIRLR